MSIHPDTRRPLLAWCDSLNFTRLVIRISAGVSIRRATAGRVNRMSELSGCNSGHECLIHDDTI